MNTVQEEVFHENAKMYLESVISTGQPLQIKRYGYSVLQITPMPNDAEALKKHHEFLQSLQYRGNPTEGRWTREELYEEALCK
jgi:hypothetical protein